MRSFWLNEPGQQEKHHLQTLYSIKDNLFGPLKMNRVPYELICGIQLTKALKLLDLNFVNFRVRVETQVQELVAAKYLIQ